MTLEPLAHADLVMADPLVVGSVPMGTRVIVELVSGRFDGRLAGQLRGKSGADWIIVSEDGTGLLDVRFTIETDEGAVVYAEAGGRIHLPAGQEPGAGVLAMTFETASTSHSWLNRTVAVARADTDGNRLRYTLYALALT